MNERNVATVERWCRDVFEGDLDLLDELFTYPYVLHSARGTVSQEPESRRQAVAAAMANTPGLRWEIDDIVARGDRVACRLTGTWLSTETGERELRGTWLEIHRLVDGRIAETWLCRRDAEVGPWQGESVPREQWSIAFAESLTPGEEANLATLNRWTDLHQNHSDDFEAVAELVTNPYAIHGPRGTRSGRPEEVVQFLVGFRERSPGYEGWFDDVFVAGDLVARRLRYRYPEPLPDRGSLQCGIALYRFEDHRIAEYWNVYLPNDVDWS
jgi:predicted SnoaL-like aldol condensation-catalyzing enzyme